ncbi:MAG: transposase domain-containing protein [Xanthomonadales bacterium]|nr:transposase domain-containing protein [Xanthomonadales bacterium]
MKIRSQCFQTLEKVGWHEHAVAIGRKNYLFVGNERSDEVTATLLSLIETAKANGLGLLTYLTRSMLQLPMIDPESSDASRATRHCSRFDSMPERSRAAQEWGAAIA